MGAITETVKIRNFLTSGEVIELPVLVDTGATLLVLAGCKSGCSCR